MKIASWNVNSVKVRLPHLLEFLQRAQPDVVCLQETKCLDADFPRLELRGLGYHVEACGQRAYNGVALLSRQPARELVCGLPGDRGDDQARYIEAAFPASAAGGEVRVGSVYLPNGNPIGTDKFAYKLAWMERLIGHAEGLLRREIPFVLAGDYNICPSDDDVYDPVAFRHDALCQPESRARFRALMNLGLTDAYRVFHLEPHRYTFWDYQAGCWQRDEGLRIDHLLLSPHAADRVAACDIDKRPRAQERASDHTPIWCELAA
ncbi:MAG: exodeoxyribonuclease III [Alphaproteobacteria bacterium]|nr:exodeoxyribonuclease III [Alphaproteobacteria bacterium]MBV9860841.1 exodeoxyribonuclease III [Alphaproteobacteria bacterium]